MADTATHSGAMKTCYPGLAKRKKDHSRAARRIVNSEPPSTGMLRGTYVRRRK